MERLAIMMLALRLGASPDLTVGMEQVNADPQPVAVVQSQHQRLETPAEKKKDS